MAHRPFYKAEVIGVDGRTLQMINDVISVQAARAFNSDGSATLVIPDDYERALFRMHARFKLWRHDYRGVPFLFGKTVWFLKKLDRDRTERTYTLTLVDAFAMLKTRLVAYTAQTPYADKTMEELALTSYNDTLRLDNMMRAYMRENFGLDALDGARINSAVVVESDLSAGPYGEKQASWQEVGATLADLAKQAAEKGTDLYYDLLPQDDGRFFFHVWTGLAGLDRRSDSDLPLVLSDDSGMITDVHEIDDYTNVATHCYALGFDSGPSQVIEEATNEALVRADPFGRIEMTVNATDSDVSTVLVDAARAALQGRSPRRMLTARIVENSTLSLGRDLDYGDGVVGQVDGTNYDCVINAISTHWEDDSEELELRLQGEVSL